MIAFSFKAPYGSGINFAGMKARVVALSETTGSSISANLDFNRTLNGNRLIVQCRGGVIEPPSALRDTYNQAQFLYTPALSAGDITLSADGVFDEFGNAIKDAPRDVGLTIGFEVDAVEASGQSPIWACWIADKLGQNRIELRADGKLLKSADVRIQQRSKAELDEIRNGGPLRIDSITPPIPKTLRAGTLIALPLSIDDLKKVKLLELKIR